MKFKDSYPRSEKTLTIVINETGKPRKGDLYIQTVDNKLGGMWTWMVLNEEQVHALREELDRWAVNFPKRPKEEPMYSGDLEGLDDGTPQQGLTTT